MIEILERLVKLEEKTNNMIRFGVVKEVDSKLNRVIVDFGNEMESPQLPYIINSSGNAKVYFLPQVGDQVMVISKNGDIAQSLVMPNIYTQAQEIKEDEWRLEFAKGSIKYSEGKLEISSTDEVTIKSKKAIIESEQIILGGEDGGDVVCTKHTCAFTGGFHPMGSSKIKGGM